MLAEIERKFNVIYPNNENATYASILNYSTEKDNPFQRWYRYKEGFSTQFVRKIVDEYSDGNLVTLLDPFAGSGTTILAANQLGCAGIGFEVNPFSFFLMKMKQAIYSESLTIDFNDKYVEIINELEDGRFELYEIPELSISGKVFQKEVENIMMSCKVKIQKVDNQQVKNLLQLGWLACIEELSEYRKAGNGLKKRKTVKPIVLDKNDVIKRLQVQFYTMYEDIKTYSNRGILNKLHNDSSINFADKINESVDGIIFSPPYANCFDYTEIYKLELWFGDFVSKYSDLKVLRSNSLRSHLNFKYELDQELFDKSPALVRILEELQTKELWDRKIPMMLRGYFEDMFNILDNCHKALRTGGFCAIVVGNSAYGGVVIPTDLLLAEYAEKIGFLVDKIEVDRYIITSSQQYEKTKKEGKFLRESVICLIRK